MLKQAKSPDGYKHLLVYKKAEELLAVTTAYTATFPRILSRLIEQMDSSARSAKANIVEGWKRNATHEYYTFLGYSIASNAELLEDFLDICLGRYETKGVKGLNGGNEKAEKGETDAHSLSPLYPISQKGEEGREWLENLRFYPLDKTLPIPVQGYLRAKELNMLLEKLQTSLLERMREKGTLSDRDRVRLAKEHNQKRQNEAEEWYKAELKKRNLVLTARGMKNKDEAERLGLVFWEYGEPEK